MVGATQPELSFEAPAGTGEVTFASYETNGNRVYDHFTGGAGVDTYQVADGATAYAQRDDIDKDNFDQVIEKDATDSVH